MMLNKKTAISVLAGAALLGAGAADAVRITPAHSGSWFDPAFDKQGFSIEILGKANDTGPERRAVVYWYTYDDNGDAIWAIGISETEGDAMTFDMKVASGGARPPVSVEASDLTDFATLSFEFGTCNQATAVFEMADDGSQGTYSLQRLTQIGATTCTGGMSDEMEPGEEVTLVAQFEPAEVELENRAGGTARVNLSDEEAFFDIDVRHIPVGVYDVQLGGESIGDIEVARAGNSDNSAAKGTLLFTSPSDDEATLLDFDPRGQIVDLVNGDGAIVLTAEIPSGE